MATVTGRIKEIKQPRGGYLPIRDFAVSDLDSQGEVTYAENISASRVGTAVDYLIRLGIGAAPADAFQVSLLGACLVGEDSRAYGLLDKLNGLDDQSIQAACELVGYDVAYRAGVIRYKPVQGMDPDSETIRAIRLMVNRTISFFQANPIVMNGFDLEGSYTDIVHAGDGDYLTKDTLWDLKVSSRKPDSARTLQILVYWIMGCRSVHPEFKHVKYLGIINPRLGKTWTIELNKISPDIIEQVSTQVIGYGCRV